MSNELSAVAPKVGASLSLATGIWMRDSTTALSFLREQLGLDDTTLACLGWPVRAILETTEAEATEARGYYHATTGKSSQEDSEEYKRGYARGKKELDARGDPTEGMPPWLDKKGDKKDKSDKKDDKKKDKSDKKGKKETTSYAFDMDKLEGADRGVLLRALQEADFKVIWELLKGQTICIPDLAEDGYSTLESILKKHKLSSTVVKEAVEPLLVGLFLLEFYNVENEGGTSKVVAEDGSIKTACELIEEIVLLESSASYKTWLTIMFPECAMEYVTFLADQAPKA